MQAIKHGLFGEEEKRKQEQSTAAAKPEAPLNQTGYGLLGVTWTPDVRWRLRIMRNVISVALQRLSNQGSLVITWHGIPNHPALMFLTSQLRPVFLRVHVLVPEGTRSWETWILASSFKRQEAEEVASKGGGGFMFKNFIDNAYRCADLDDCLLWTLPMAGLLDEYRLGGGDRSVAKGYNELWSMYAQKFRDLGREFGSVFKQSGQRKETGKKTTPAMLGGGAADPKAKAKGKAKAKAKAKEKKEKKDKAKTKSADSDEEDAGKSEGEGAATAAAGETKAAPKAAPAAPKAAPANTGLPPLAKAKAKPTTPGAAADDQVSKPKRKPFNPSRSLPNLACTFGCAPGVKKGYPNEFKLGQEYPIIARAVDYLEKTTEIVRRIDREDILYAMKMTQTEKFKQSEEGARAGDVKINLVEAR
jgi:hypothetical protein